MSFDCSRFTFDPRDDFFGVVMQQGRVQLDSDWNEWLAELSRRIQAETLDILGRAAVPETTKDAFKIGVGHDSAGNVTLTIGPGRMYVDGLLAECHGIDPLEEWIPAGVTTATGPSTHIFHKPPFVFLPKWDGALDEFAGIGSRYDLQPYYPNADIIAPFPQSGGPYLAYLDVWLREITFLEHPDIVEKAVGVDTTGRIQIVWQVKWLDVSRIANVDCSSDIPAWDDLLLPPGPRLTTGVEQTGAPGPCCLTPNTGYTGQENQLYRVEIHQPGDQKTATFKWSRDNASVATGVLGVDQSGMVLTVESTGKDSVLRFNPNDWVEVRDDWLELAGLPGELHQIASVSDPDKTITLATPVSPANFPVDSNGLTDLERHTRLVRWDQSGKVLESDNTTVWVDLNAPGATGDIPVPPAGTSLILENGVTVSFDLLKKAKPFTTDDYWVFAARATDGTIEFLDGAPPRGIYHHFARLAIVGLSSVALPLTTGATATLQDESQPPIPFLNFGITDPTTWPANFGVVTQANAANPANFDLEVVYNPATAEDVSLPVVVESFTDLSLTKTDANYAPTVINGNSNLITVPASFSPPTQTPKFAASFSSSPSMLPNTGDLNLTDTSASPIVFLTVDAMSPANWPQFFTLSASPGANKSVFTLEVVYGASDGSFGTVERFPDLTLTAASIGTVTSQFLTGLALPASLPNPAPELQLITLTDCRTFWPPSAGDNCCCCTVDIQPGADLQAIVDQYQNLRSETVICLAPGTYTLAKPLLLNSAHANITIKSCMPGQATLQAETNNGIASSDFEQGLIVLDSSSNITLSGLFFDVPVAPLNTATDLFAGLPLNALPPDLQVALDFLAIRIGVRPVNCNGFTVEDCLFDFRVNVDQNRDSKEQRRDIGFGAGIFAAGRLESLKVTGCTFGLGGDFVAGFLHAPSVSFGSPPSIDSIRGLPTRFNVEAAAVPKAKTTQEVTRALSKMTDAFKNVPQTTPSVSFFPPASVAGAQSLAANGGQVVPAYLSGAVFEGNTFERLTNAALIVAEADAVDFVKNTVVACRTGCWLVSPLQSGLLLLDSKDGDTLSVLLLAYGYPLPQTALSHSVTIAPAPAPVLVYAGASDLTDSLGTWVPDASSSSAFSVSGGNLNQSNSGQAITNAQPDATVDQPLYSSERWGNPFTYTFPGLPEGFYVVNLKFAELFDTAAGQRLFNVKINGQQVLTNFDVFGQAGGQFIGVDQTYASIPATGGQITIEFDGTTISPDTNAKIGAIGIGAEWNLPASSTNNLAAFYQQMAILSAQGYAGSGLGTLRLRIDGNEMSTLSSTAVFVLWDDLVQNGKVSSLMMSGNRLINDAETTRLTGFGGTVLIAFLTRCVVTGNMIMNERLQTLDLEQNFSLHGACFTLNDSTVPVAEIAVMSNVFQGLVEIAPERNTGAPYPMNTWEFMNTVI